MKVQEVCILEKEQPVVCCKKLKRIYKRRRGN